MGRLRFPRRREPTDGVPDAMLDDPDREFLAAAVERVLD
jgi:hypothetical protein